MQDSHRQHFQSLLSEHDIAGVAGVDLLRLVRTLSNIYEVIVTNRLRDANLSGPRWRMLLLLYMAEIDGESTGQETALSPSEISRIQNVTKNTISSLLRSLEDQGLIERRLDYRGSAGLSNPALRGWERTDPHFYTCARSISQHRHCDVPLALTPASVRRHSEGYHVGLSGFPIIAAHLNEHFRYLVIEDEDPTAKKAFYVFTDDQASDGVAPMD